MWRSRWPALLVLGASLGFTLGCKEKSKYVPVSGVVKLNNKPYPNAAVIFQPVGSKEDPNPGRGSSGVTDANGRFHLKTSEGVDGAVIGMHQIKIITNSAEMIGFDPEVGSPDNVPGPAKDKFDPIPIEWRTLGAKTFEVPAGGTTEANFDIENPKVKN